MDKPRPVPADEFSRRISTLRGQAAAVVYSFEGSKSFHRIWYDQWRSGVISSYGHALEELGLQPYFVEVKDFALQALASNLPNVVCAFNLNAGITPISNWALVPSVASWTGIPIFPANADVLIVGERKDTAALLAKRAGLNIPRTYSPAELQVLENDHSLIVKPRDLGGSVGVRRVTASDVRNGRIDIEPTSIVQDFVRGFDFTIPIVWQPTQGRHRAPAGILYTPTEEKGEDWFHSELTKQQGEGYKKRVIPISEDIETEIRRFADLAELGPYARVDFRWENNFECTTKSEIRIDREELIFIEVNPLPTLRSAKQSVSKWRTAGVTE